MTRHRELLESDELAAAFPIFRDAERVIADPVVRNRGTLGGSLCQADPSEDLSAVCTTLDASCVIRGPGASGSVSMEEFHRRPVRDRRRRRRDPDRGPLPGPPGGGSAYEKVERRAGDWAVVSAGAAVWLDGDGRDRRRPGRAGRGRAEHHRHPRGRGAARPAPVEELFAEAGAIAAEALRPGHRPARQRRLQAAPGGRADQARAAPRPSSRRRTGGLTMQVTMTVNGERSPGRSRGGCCSCTSCATTSA
jgi:carbon-monoxide dehydrogenase medium subunit